MYVVLTKGTFCQCSKMLGMRETERRHQINIKKIFKIKCKNVVVIVGTIWLVQVVKLVLGNYSPSCQAPP